MTTKQTVLTMGKEEDYFILNLKQQDSTYYLFLQSGVQFKLLTERIEKYIFCVFNFKLVWFKLLQNRGTKLSNGLLAKKKS